MLATDLMTAMPGAVGGLPLNIPSRVLIALKPETRTLHLSLNESDIAALVTALGHSVQSCVAGFHPPTPVPDSSSIAGAVITLQSPRGLSLVTQLNGLELPGVGTLEAMTLSASETLADKLQEQFVAGQSTGLNTAALKQLASMLARPVAETPGPNPGEVRIFMARLELVNLFSCDDFDVTAELRETQSSVAIAALQSAIQKSCDLGDRISILEQARRFFYLGHFFQGEETLANFESSRQLCLNGLKLDSGDVEFKTALADVDVAISELFLTDLW